MAILNRRQRQLLQFLFQQFQEDGRDEENYRRLLMLLLSSGTGDSIARSFARQRNIDRDRRAGHQRLLNDYFSENAVYTADMFRRRFRMRRPVFDRILAASISTNEYFVQRPDALGVLGLSALQKIVAALRMLAYDKSADSVDEYIRIGESTTLCSLREFCSTLIHVFGAEYLRQPTAEDMERILKHSANRGFPGMLGSMDCMHWNWKNCPRAWAGQFLDRSGSNSLILEAVATYDLWIWHSFFGMPGSNNDINVLDKSHLFTTFLQGRAPIARFVINNRNYNMCYYLADGIYPQWPVFVQTISNPLIEKRKHFAIRQEAARKDVERCFGVLRGRWAILRNPTRLWQRATLHNIMMSCIILHNMVVEDEQSTLMATPDDLDMEVHKSLMRSGTRVPLSRMIGSRVTMRNADAYHILQTNLVEHLWSARGQQA